MVRDRTIEKIFTVADDSMQAVWGLHSYTNAAVSNASRRNLTGRLPQDKFRMTHHWYRFYNPKGLVSAMKRVYTPIHCRLSLALLVSIFEEATCRLRERLHKLKKVSKPKESYKRNLRWVFDIVRNSSPDDPSKQDARKMWSRLPVTCGDVDNARRLRNQWAHHRGRYTAFYKRDAIKDKWLRKQMEKGYTPNGPIKITNARFEYFCRSHIELLHILHTVIQNQHFNASGFNYAREGKRIDLRQILS